MTTQVYLTTQDQNSQFIYSEIRQIHTDVTKVRRRLQFIAQSQYFNALLDSRPTIPTDAFTSAKVTTVIMTDQLTLTCDRPLFCIQT